MNVWKGHRLLGPAPVPARLLFCLLCMGRMWGQTAWKSQPSTHDQIREFDFLVSHVWLGELGCG